MPESQEVGKSKLAHNATQALRERESAHNATQALRERESAHNAKLVSLQNVSFSPPPPLPVIFFFIYFLFIFPRFRGVAGGLRSYGAVVAKLRSLVLREGMAINDSLLM